MERRFAAISSRTGLTALAALMVFAIGCFVSLLANDTIAQESVAENAREYYELQIYQIFDIEKKELMTAFLKDAWHPAAKRAGIEKVGFFSNSDVDDHSIIVLVPYESVEQYASFRDKLHSDEEYVKALQEFSDRPIDDPVYSRIESRFMKSFAGIPKLELAEYSKDQSARMFELRLYESHTQDHARRKVKMFNEGELQLMRDVEMAPVFFGETLAGPDVPNLVYMLSATDIETHKGHWRDFLNDPRWEKMKDLEEYKDTVSKIRNWMLVPLDFSDI